MNNQNLVIYEYPYLYQILKELEQDINFKITELSKENLLNNETKELKNYLIITKKKFFFDNQFVLNQLPINIFKLIEKLNVVFLRQQFNNQSEIDIGKYKINLNSRVMSSKSSQLKLTEKEVNTIIYLSRIKEPVSINELQKKVWGYKSDMETHTVETHIYRLRKKIFISLKDENFIISKKNGYQVK